LPNVIARRIGQGLPIRRLDARARRLGWLAGPGGQPLRPFRPPGSFNRMAAAGQKERNVGIDQKMGLVGSTSTARHDREGCRLQTSACEYPTTRSAFPRRGSGLQAAGAGSALRSAGVETPRNGRNACAEPRQSRMKGAISRGTSRPLAAPRLRPRPRGSGASTMLPAST
jgi:hypothetical protein